MSLGWLVVKRMRASPSILSSSQMSCGQGHVARGPRAVIGVHVLAQKGDFPHTAIDQIARLFQDPIRRATDLGAAGIGHHAEGAELVAAFLHGQERGRAALGLGPFAQRVELVIFGKSVSSALAPSRVFASICGRR